MLELVAHPYSDNRNRLKDDIFGLCHCNIDQPGPLNCSGGSAIPSFCHRNHCREMPTANENNCCMQLMCRSLTLIFKNISLDIENIQTAIRNLADTFVFTPMYENKAMRHAAYRQYVMWQHGHLGSGRWLVTPSCCVWAIRNLYSSPTGVIPSKRITVV